MPMASLSLLLYQVSLLFRLLLANATGYNAALSGFPFLGNHILSLNCRRLVPRSILDIFVSRYSSSFSFYNTIVASF